jgi:hypothetical protein
MGSGEEKRGKAQDSKEGREGETCVGEPAGSSWKVEGLG